jgi:hypothetical protein
MIEIFKISLIAFMFCALGQNKKSLFHWYQKLISDLPWYISWPLGRCYKCFTGQVCLWYFIFTKPFNVVELLFFISSGIFISMIYNRIYCLIK